MSTPIRVLRKGSILGLKHESGNINNQDSVELMEFAIPRWNTNYRVGIVADGCTGVPAFSRSEVGSNLLTVFCAGRIQELIVAGAKPAEIPVPLYHAVTGFLRNLSNMVMPANVHWPYPIKFKGNNEFRNAAKAPQRFMLDYLSATILGYVDDGETLVVFRAGDGVIIVNDEVIIVDQNDTPEYPSVSVNSPGAGFQVTTYASAEVRRLGLATDGLKKLLQPTRRVGLPDALFFGVKGSGMDLQFLLNRMRKNRELAEFLGDDCTVLTYESFEGVDNGSESAGDG